MGASRTSGDQRGSVGLSGDQWDQRDQRSGGYVDLAEHWGYSSVRNYAGEEGLRWFPSSGLGTVRPGSSSFRYPTGLTHDS